jgi:hypothetical protein
MPIYFSLQQDEIQKQHQGVVFDIWICEFEAFALSLALGRSLKESGADQRIVRDGDCMRIHRPYRDVILGVCR